MTDRNIDRAELQDSCLCSGNQECAYCEDQMQAAEQQGKPIDEYIEVHRRPDGRVAMVVRVPNDPNNLAFTLVRDTYEECLAEWRKFDSWMVRA